MDWVEDLALWLYAIVHYLLVQAYLVFIEGIFFFIEEFSGLGSIIT
jgi:hypothetical protein